jgi:tRNA modification GTPase
MAETVPIRAVASLETPPGTGAIAVVLLTGPDAPGVLEHVFEPRAGTCPTKRQGRFTRGTLRDAAGVVDDALVLALAVESAWEIEFHLHGSARAVQRLIGRLRALGVECPGDMEDAGRLGLRSDTVLIAEIRHALARCRSRRAVRFVVQQARNLPAWLSQLEFGVTPDNAEAVRRQLEAMAGRYDRDRLLLDGLHVAIIGPVNAGKSTLANRLFGEPFAVESSTRGTTRDWVEEPTAFGGLPLILTDTAGLSVAETDLEAEAIDRGLGRAFLADMRWFVIDGAAPRDPETDTWLERLSGDRDTLLLLNKSDLGPSPAVQPMPAGWADRAVPLSARTGAGLGGLRQRIEQWADLSPIEVDRPALVCHAQAERVRSALARWTSGAQLAVRAMVADFRQRAGIE